MGLNIAARTQIYDESGYSEKFKVKEIKSRE